MIFECWYCGGVISGKIDDECPYCGRKLSTPELEGKEQKDD